MRKIEIQINEAAEGFDCVVCCGTLSRNIFIARYRDDADIATKELRQFFLRSFLLMMESPFFSDALYLDAVSNYPLQHRSVLGLFGIFWQHLSDRSPLVVPPQTVTNYGQTKRVLKDYLTYQKDLQLPYTMIDVQWMQGFRGYIAEVRGNSGNTAHMHCKQIKKMIEHALDHGWTHLHTARDFETPKERHSYPYLTMTEVVRIQNTTFAKPHLQLVQQVFLVQCYTGISYVDMVHLSEADFKTDDTYHWLEFKRKKSGTRCIIPLLPAAMAAIDKARELPFDWRGRSQQGLFPIHHCVNYNAYLKQLAVKCKVRKNISSHTARRTFATTIALEHGASLRSIGKMLGHSRYTQTSDYAIVSDEKIKKEMAGIL